ncbi:MAG: dihydropteroate synthase [Candidatus Saganbacteria bacterium]|nr:dihydropteroate synthase [Candidatus Saganbacteria bacterium]
MTARLILIPDIAAAKAELAAIGSDPTGIEIMAPKAVSLVFKVKGLKPTAANIIKQEMLSFGAEAATAYGSIDHSVKTTDLLLFGTHRQLRQLIAKLKAHQFGLPQLALELETALQNYFGAPAPLRLGEGQWTFGQRTYIMGVVNVTPDSFSDGGQCLDREAAVARAKQLIADGADIIDVGGESTRPGAKPLPVKQEIDRVVPVIEQLGQETAVPVSIDTTKAEVAEAAVAAGAVMINDISGLHFDSRLAAVAAKSGTALCLMHIKGRPGDMQQDPRYTDLISEIIEYLSEGLAIGKKAGILHEKILIDPGIGFGKTVAHNLEILRRLRELKVLGRPILIGTSRKSLIGAVLDLPVKDRLEGTAATVALAVNNGADIIRVHDVKEMARVARMSDAIVRQQEDQLRRI